MQLSFRQKIQGVIAILIVACAAFAFLLTSRWLYDDKSGFSRELTSQVAMTGANMMAERVHVIDMILKDYASALLDRKIVGGKVTGPSLLSPNSPLIAVVNVQSTTGASAAAPGSRTSGAAPGTSTSAAAPGTSTSGAAPGTSSTAGAAKSSWDVISFEKQSNPSSEVYVADFENQLLVQFRDKFLKESVLESLEPNKTTVAILPGDGKSKTFAFARLTFGKNGKADGARAIVALVPESYLSVLTRPYKGTFTSLYFVDTNGRAIAHPNESWIGTRLTQNPVVATLVQSGRRTFSNEQGEGESAVYASFEAVDGTNLASIVSIPLKATHRTEKNLVITLIGLIIAAGIGIAIAIRALFEHENRLARTVSDILRRDQNQFFEREEQIFLSEGAPWTEVRDAIRERRKSEREGFIEASSEEFREASPTTPELSANHPEMYGIGEMTPIRPPAKPIAVFSRAPDLSAKLEALEEAGQSLSREMKNPISAILGHTHLAIKKTESVELQKHLDFIDREVRSLRDTVEKVSKLGFYRALSLFPKPALELMNDAVSLAEVEANLLGVKLRKDFYPVSQIRVSESEFLRLMSEFIVSRARVMKDARVTDLYIHVEPFEDRVRIRIRDFAEPMSDEQARALTEPAALVGSSWLGSSGFPSSRQFNQRNARALDLVALVVSHGGQLSARPLDYEEGNEIQIDFPAVFDAQVSDETGSSQNEVKLSESHLSLIREQAGNVGLDFIEAASRGIERMASSNKETIAEKPVTATELAPGDLPAAPPVPSSALSEFSVKVRAPRLNL